MTDPPRPRPSQLIERPSQAVEVFDGGPGQAPWWHWWTPRRIAVVVVLVLLAASPWLAWQLTPPRRLAVVVLDKTRPRADAREHEMLMWWMDHRRLRAADGRALTADRDYVGWHPTAGRGDTLQAPALAGAALAYLADAYGVYTADTATTALGQLQRSQAVYGGLLPAEVSALADFRAHGGAIVAEFNTLASPTWGSAAEGPASALLGASYAGWLGKYYGELGNEDEVPQWMRDKWQRFTRQPWRFRGAGVVVFSERDDRIVVLTAEQFAGDVPVRLAVDSAAHPLLRGVRDGTPYWYWFSGLEPGPGSAVIASYVLDVTEAGKRQLRAAHFPDRFPALVTVPGGPLLLVASGELADLGGQLPPLVHTRGLDGLQRWMAGRARAGNPMRRFWGVSLPVWDNVADSLLRQAR